MTSFLHGVRGWPDVSETAPVPLKAVYTQVDGPLSQRRPWCLLTQFFYTRAGMARTPREATPAAAAA